MDVDIDFPAEHAALWFQAANDTEIDPITQEVKALDQDRWREIRQALYDHRYTSRQNL